MAPADRTPVLVAVGQAVERDELVTPLDMLERAARAALVEAPGVERRLQQLTVVNVMSGGHPSLAGALASSLKLDGVRTAITTVGGNSPVWLLGEASAAIARGELEAALVVGGEAMRSNRQRRKGGARRSAESDERPHAELEPDEVIGDARSGLGPAESAIGLIVPAQVYPLFESVLAHRAGRTFAEQRAFLGALMAPFTEVAAKHPIAWFQEPATPEELAEPSPANRLTAEPYTKRMNAILAVDQSAAYIVTSLSVAADLGLTGQAIHVWSVANANDVWYVPERPDLGRSPGVAAAGRAALTAAGLGIDDIGSFDLYSCFPCAVQLGAEALGLSLDDRRGLTVTGGLPYFGGPGNNYPTHALATTVDRLRERGGAGLVTGLGWYATKHSVAVIAADPPPDGFRAGDTSEAQGRIDESAIPVAMDAAGRATVEASTVLYNRDGSVDGVPVIATTDDGARVVARAPAEDHDDLAGESLVGRRVEVRGAPLEFRVAD